MTLRDRLLAMRKWVATSRPTSHATSDARSDPIAAGEAIVAALKAAGIIPGNSMPAVHIMRGGGEPVSHPVNIESGAVDTRPGIRPPPDPQVDHMTWSRWRQITGCIPRQPGWALCRFPNRAGYDGDGIGFVFGLVKGDYGVWTQPMRVCHHDDHDEEEPPTALLTSLSHLPSGLGMGIFNDQATACEAADLAESHIGAVTPFVPEDETTHAAWNSFLDRVHAAWTFNGIGHADNWHCHLSPAPSAEVGIWTKTAANLTAGQPEKMS